MFKLCRSMLVVAVALLSSMANVQTAGTDYLTTDKVLLPNEYLVSPIGRFFAIQKDASFCVYAGSISALRPPFLSSQAPVTAR